MHVHDVASRTGVQLMHVHDVANRTGVQLMHVHDVANRIMYMTWPTGNRTAQSSALACLINCTKLH